MFLGNNLLVRSNQLIKFVAILKPDVCIISTAIFVPLGGAQIWGPHSEPYKFLWHILKKNSAAENCMDVRLGQVVNLSIFYNIEILNGFRPSLKVLILVFDGVIVKTMHQFTSQPSRSGNKKDL